MTRTCTLEDCEKPLYSNGLCSMHDARRRRHGDVNKVDPRRGGPRKEPRPVKHGTQWALQGLGCRCDICLAGAAERSRVYAARNRSKVAERRLQKEYGLSRADFDAMSAAQGGVCLICGDAPEDKPLFVDHCHTTGRVRGLLCSRCNTGIGMFLDDPDRLVAAAAYVLQQTNVLREVST
jgi:hypothetical protein